MKEGKVSKGGQNFPEDIGVRPEPPRGQSGEWDALKEKIGRLDGKSKHIFQLMMLHLPTMSEENKDKLIVRLYEILEIK